MWMVETLASFLGWQLCITGVSKLFSVVRRESGWNRTLQGWHFMNSRECLSRFGSSERPSACTETITQVGIQGNAFGYFDTDLTPHWELCPLCFPSGNGNIGT